MSLSHRLPILVLAVCLVGFRPLAAQTPVTAPPIAVGKEFTATVQVVNKDGTVITQKMYVSNGNVRSDLSMNGSAMVVIVRPEQQHIFSIIEAQKMIMVMPYDPHKANREVAAATGLDGSYVKIGSETINGVACTKYLMTSPAKNVYAVWVDDAQKIPVKMEAADHSFSMVYTDYKVGPQDPTLFEVPTTGYQVMAMPAMPGAPSGGGSAPGTP